MHYISLTHPLSPTLALHSHQNRMSVVNHTYSRKYRGEVQISFLCGSTSLLIPHLSYMNCRNYRLDTNCTLFTIAEYQSTSVMQPSNVVLFRSPFQTDCLSSIHSIRYYVIVLVGSRILVWTVRSLTKKELKSSFSGTLQIVSLC